MKKLPRIYHNNIGNINNNKKICYVDNDNNRTVRNILNEIFNKY